MQIIFHTKDDYKELKNEPKKKSSQKNSQKVDC